MRFDKFTLKAQEVIQNAQEIASQRGHQQIEPVHLLYALLEQREGVIPPLLGKIGVKEDTILQDLRDALDQLPSVSGAGLGDAYISPRSKAVSRKYFLNSLIKAQFRSTPMPDQLLPVLSLTS